MLGGQRCRCMRLGGLMHVFRYVCLRACACACVLTLEVCRQSEYWVHACSERPNNDVTMT